MKTETEIREKLKAYQQHYQLWQHHPSDYSLEEIDEIVSIKKILEWVLE